MSIPVGSLFNQSEDSLLSDQYELQGLERSSNAEKKEAGQRVDCHDVIEVALDRFIQVSHDGLGGMDCLQAQPVLALLGVDEGKEFEG